jgi:hypothetical protein
MKELEDQLRRAEDEEQFQVVGTLAREVLISLAQAVYDRSIHGVIEDGIEPSETDARRMLEAYIDHELRGGSNEEARQFAKTAIKLAPAVAHKRTATQREARLCAVVTESMIRVVEVFANRGRDAQEWVGVEARGRYFAWDGPTLHALEDRQPQPTPPFVIEAVREAGMTPSFGNRDRLPEARAKGALHVYETDRRTWRRELLYADDGRQVLLVKPTKR